MIKCQISFPFIFQNQYHRYRCDNKDCGEIFIPIIPQRRSLNWWQNTDEGSVDDITIYCTKCGCEQRLDWYHEIKRSIERTRQSETRRRLYQIFKQLENVLLGLNDVRSYVALKFCSEWFKLPYRKLISIFFLTTYTYSTIRFLFRWYCIE